MLNGYVGVILAAGQGKRMGPLGEEYPKALLPVANEPLISHHLRLLHSLGVRKIFVIVGHCAPRVVQALGGGEAYGVDIQYVEQGASLGSAHALGRVRSKVQGPFLLVLGDYYFWPSDPHRLVRRLEEGRGSAISVKREPDRRLLSEACELQVNPEGRVLKIVEKPSAPGGDLKGCGFYALQPEVFDAVARTPRTALRDEYELSVSLQLYLEAGHCLYSEEVIVWDSNLTRPEDLLECNLHWLAHQGRNELIAEGARIEQGTTLERTLVGVDAWIASNSTLREVVVFPGAKVSGDSVLGRTLATPNGLYPCCRG